MTIDCHVFDPPTFSAGAVYSDPDVNITHSDRTGQSANAKISRRGMEYPNLHFIAPVNDQFGWGASITSNYGGYGNLPTTSTLLVSMAVKPICKQSTLTLAGLIALTIAGVLVLVLMQFMPRQN